MLVLPQYSLNSIIIIIPLSSFDLKHFFTWRGVV